MSDSVETNPAKSYDAVIDHPQPLPPLSGNDQAPAQPGQPYDQSTLQAQQAQLHNQIAAVVENHPGIEGSRP